MLLFLKTERPFALEFTIISCLLSPSRSPNEIETGEGPVAKLDDGEYEREIDPIELLFLRTEIKLEAVFTTTGSTSPSPSRSVAPILLAINPHEESIFAENEFAVKSLPSPGKCYNKWNGGISG